MKQKLIGNFVLLGLIICISAANSVAIRMPDTTIAYPYAIFSINDPVADEKVSLKWVLGIHPDGCVPKYETSISKTVLADRIIKHSLKYKENAIIIDDKMICAQVLTPYGPQFDLGALEGGYLHQIFINDILVREFKIAAANSAPFAVVRPDVPVIGDSLSVQWILGVDSVNCVPQYTGKVVSHSMLKTNPPTHVIKVEYEKKEVQYIACIPRITQYGPVFNLGIAEEGNYEIYNDTTLVTRFAVNLKNPMQLMKTIPEQPVEGDTLQLRLITGYGSSSCAPIYTPHFEMISGENDQFIYKLTYEVAFTDSYGCTDDYVEHGPVWVLPNVKSGYYLFSCPDNEYYKVYVQQKRKIPDFQSVTIKGTVYEANYDAKKIMPDTITNSIRTVVAQCTVAVVIYQSAQTKAGSSSEKSEDLVASLIVSDSVAPDKVNSYYAVTDENGNYVIRDIPSAALLNSSYTVAYKNGRLGYGSIPLILSEEVISNITIYKYESFIDTAIMIPLADDVIELMKNLGGEPSEVKHTAHMKNAGASIIQTKGGFHLINPSKQQISVAVYSLDGKRIWNLKTGQLSQGKHFFTIPQFTAGTFLIRVSGENFNRTGIISLTK